MKKYTKIIDGKTVIESRSNITITMDGMTTYNPTEEMLFADGWVEYFEDYIINIDSVRVEKIEEVKNYDTSDEVNIFYVKDYPIWLDKSTRAGLILRFNAESNLGKTETSLWYDGIEFVLPIENAIQMLYAIEVYASQCYDNTQKHLSAINKLETKQEIVEYDFREGYPEPLVFDI